MCGGAKSDALQFVRSHLLATDVSLTYAHSVSFLLYFVLYLVGALQSNLILLAGDVAHVLEMRSAYGILVRKTVGKKLNRTWCWCTVIKRILRKYGLMMKTGLNQLMRSVMADFPE
jgi:hypothetical protein